MQVTIGAATRSLLIAGVLIALGACGQPSGPGTGAGEAAPGEIVLRRGNAAEPYSLDPHQASGTWENSIIGDMLIGLTTEASDGAPIPGAALSWETSEDGLTWTFHLREHNWSDGVPVTAEDFVYGWRRLLDPQTAAAYAYFLYPVKNAEAVNSGALPTSELGVSASDEKTLVVQLEHPAPYLVEFMTHYSTFAIPRHVVEVHGNAWTRPENYVSNGAYTLQDWISNDQIVLLKNPLFYDAENVQVDRVIFFPTSNYEAALRRFRAGELDMQERLPELQIDWLRQNMPEVLRMEPILTVEFVAMNESRPPLDNVRVREALSLGLNRELLTEQVIRTGHKATYSMIPPGIANYPGGVELSFKDMPQDQRLARAKMLMEEAGFGPDNRFQTTLLVRSASPEKRREPAAMQQMWGEIYVDIEIVQTDAAVFYRTVQENDFDLATAGWAADFNDAENYLYLLRTGSKENYGLYSNPEYDALLVQSTQETNVARRGELLAQAERIALDDHAWLPYFNWVSLQLVYPYIDGWVNNPRNINRTRWVTMDTEARAAMFD